jgi:hypothetical protein
MKSPGPFLSVVVTAGMFLAVGPCAHAKYDDENRDAPPIAWLTVVEGDIRYSPKNELLDSRKPWEQAEEDMTIDPQSALAAEDGRAEIEFQDGIKIFLAEDSILIFRSLRVRDGKLDAKVSLERGTATVFIPKTTSDSLVFGSQVHHMRLDADTFARMDSYSNGTGITARVDGGVIVEGKKELKFAKDEGLFFPAGKETPEAGVHVSAQPSWDDWADWLATHPATVIQPCGRRLTFSTQPSGCGAPLVLPWCVGLPASRPWTPDCDPRPQLSEFANLDAFHHRHHMHEHLTWVRAGGKVGYVHADPRDRKGQRPIDLKNGMLIPAKTIGAHPERIPVAPSEKVSELSRAPKEFRGGLSPELQRASPPQGWANAMRAYVAQLFNPATGRAVLGGRSGELAAHTTGSGLGAHASNVGSSETPGGHGSAGGRSGGAGSTGGHYSGGGSYIGGGASGGAHGGGGGGGGGGYSGGGNSGGGSSGGGYSGSSYSGGVSSAGGGTHGGGGGGGGGGGHSR